MACDNRLKPQQTISERTAEVRSAVLKIAMGLATGKIRPVIGTEGAIAFVGVNERERDGVTDACAYRRVMSGQNAQAKLAIMRAEQLAGRTVDRQRVAQGQHSHDNGATWHSHKG